MTPIEQAAQALREIADWQLPAPTGQCWPGTKNVMSYETQFGSEGAKAYIRGVARAALASLEAAKQEPLTDAQCDAIYDELDAWARDVDQHDFYGLPAFSRDKGREAIRKALAAAPSPGSET